MTRLLGTLVLLLGFLAIVGYFRGWFEVQTISSGNQSHINLTVNKSAIRADEARVENRAADVRAKSEESVTAIKTPAASR